MAAFTLLAPNSTLLEWTNNSDNVTKHATEESPQTVFDIVVLACMAAIMLAMGCEATIPELRMHLRKPISMIIGMFSQFVFLPLLAFATIKMLGIRGLYATSILILACSPGGGYSNLLTYLSEGDVTLSVTMTTVSNVLALGMTPLNIYLYSKAIDTGGVVTPYPQMVISLLTLTAILALGMAIRWKWPFIASKVTKLGVGASALMAVACGILAVIYRSDGSMVLVPWYLYVAVLIMAPSGLGFAYAAAWAFHLGPKIRRTVAIESAVQSIGTAITIVIVSFHEQKYKKQASLYSILYACATVVGLLCAIAVFRIYRRFCQQKTIDVEIDEVTRKAQMEQEPDKARYSAVASSLPGS